LKREIITTLDGSKTIFLSEWNEHYHSKHGAIQEAYHVFIQHGLYHFYHPKLDSESKHISILEVGFGTGLNAFITMLEAEKLGLNINYVGVEAFPIEMDEVLELNYPTQLSVEDKADVFRNLHETAWGLPHIISNNFKLTKRQLDFLKIKDINNYNLIYFDAFGARVQPELWTKSVFKKMYIALKINGVLVTYSAKGSVRRAMKEVGFKVEKCPGPPGKREMLKAIKC
jgi:tRNA U34 5-methylaminomethyl-2-thiouridine-forming methyltransferase MnmC